MFSWIQSRWLSFGIFCLCSAVQATSVGIGFSVAPSTSQIDHFKYGPSLGLSVFQKSKWHFNGSAELITVALSPVNPGAGPSTSSPDQKESYSGSTVFVGEAWLQAPGGFSGAKMSLGNITYFPDFSRAPAIGVPFSLATQLLWPVFGRQETGFRGELSFSAGLNPLNGLVGIGITEFAFLGNLSKTFSLRLGAKAIGITGHETPTLVRLITSLRLMTHF